MNQEHPIDIAGVVTSSKGPEAGVWVIAETSDLPTHYIKAVVTDDRGRYLIPDLPKAKYTVWARGYGLVDSPKVETEPGKLLDVVANEYCGYMGRRTSSAAPLAFTSATASAVSGFQ